MVLCLGAELKRPAHTPKDHFRPSTFLAAFATIGGQNARAIRIAVLSFSEAAGLRGLDGKSEL